LCVGSFVWPFAPHGQRGSVEVVLSLLLFSMLIPGGLHFSAQGKCGELPVSHGQHIAGGSYVLLLLGLACWLIPHWAQWEWIVAVAGLISFGLWLWFFVQLGTALGDDALRDDARACRKSYVFSAARVAMLLIWADVVAEGNRTIAAGFLRLVASGVVL